MRIVREFSRQRPKLQKTRKVTSRLRWEYSFLSESEEVDKGLRIFSFRKPTGYQVVNVQARMFSRNVSQYRCHIGWDVDRQRIFVEGKSQNYLSKLRWKTGSRLLRESWERNNGYADYTQFLPKNIEAFLRAEAQKA